jgi:phosphoglycerol geranylgeranyltransferase
MWHLIDPESLTPAEAAKTAEVSVKSGSDAILIGASTGSPRRFEDVCKAVKEAVKCPVLIFPNGAAQVVPWADAIIFMSLLSGRNPEFLIGEQVKGAPLVKKFGLEAIPTAYLLIESGKVTTVETVSKTQPIPRDQIEVATAHALAARYMGMRMVYLEAGSGAPNTVPLEMVRACVQAGLAITVGGGIRTPDQAAAMAGAGAHFVVAGNGYETNPDWGLFREFVDAVHSKTSVQA